MFWENKVNNIKIWPFKIKFSKHFLETLFSACINFHDRENMPKTDGICVANHTSPIDVVILSVDRPYALVGQSHPGFMGIFQVESKVTQMYNNMI